MTFKNNWERTDQQVKVPLETIQAMVVIALPGKKLASYEVISGGCANFNIKIHLLNEPQPLICGFMCGITKLPTGNKSSQSLLNT